MPTEDDSCNICEGDRSTSKNPIIFCDGKDCNLPVHKRCYHVQSIPKGEWYCERCECQRKNKPVNIVCCSVSTGAIKKTALTGEYMHVVCALWNKAIKHEKEPYSIPEAQIGAHECYFCSQKQGLCIKCEQTNCSTYFHATCAINNGIITAAANVPHNFSPRCSQHQIKSNTGAKKRKRRLRPSKAMLDTEEESEEETESEDEVEDESTAEEDEEEDDDVSEEEEFEEINDIRALKKSKPAPKRSLIEEEDSDDDMGTNNRKKIPLKRRVSPDEEIIKKSTSSLVRSEETFSYKERLEAKRKKTGLEKPVATTPPLPPLPPPKQKLPNKSHLNTNTIISQKTPPVKKIDLEELQNDIRNTQRWNNPGLHHPQPTTPHSVNALFFENEANKVQGARKPMDGWKVMNGEKEELNRLREESRKFDYFKRTVTEIFQGLNVPVQGVDPSQDVELYVTQLQLLLKRVGPIREDERVQIGELVKESMKK